MLCPALVDDRLQDTAGLAGLHLLHLLRRQAKLFQVLGQLVRRQVVQVHAVLPCIERAVRLVVRRRRRSWAGVHEAVARRCGIARPTWRAHAPAGGGACVHSASLAN